MDTYKQEMKCQVRHTVIRKAVDLLTTNRSSSCCVRNSYVRDLYDYFTDLKETHEQLETAKIDSEYIHEWEHIHTNFVGYKRPEELSICYLSGPEPENDFNEFVAMGVLPQNIWAFECERNTYLQALYSLDGSTYKQPKVIKTSIEHFFESTPKTFDIVYIDACASLISDQHALRCISSLFQNHRLSSPGILISNIAYLAENDANERKNYIDLISKYNIIRNNRSAYLINNNGDIRFQNEFDEVERKVSDNLEAAYGDFITLMICSAASITIPSLRFCNSNYLQSVSTTKPIPNTQYSIQDINTIRDNTLCKFLAMNSFIKQQSACQTVTNRIDKLVTELSGKPMHYNLLSSIQKIHNIRTKSDNTPLELKEVIDFFDNSQALYQFLDKPNRALFFDSVINQLSYPMHYVTDKVARYTYVAKEKRMFTDLIPFDECRYIYDWIPAIHQIIKSFSNPSWQYIFRFSLDGLIKQRLNYNNEFFFQGSVVSKATPGFEAKSFPDRIHLN